MSKTLNLGFFCILILSLLGTSVYASFNETEAIDYAYASALTHCDPAIIQSWTCGVACLNLTGYESFFAQMINVSSKESFVFALLQNPSTKKFVTAFRGTVGNFELLLEVLEGNPVPYELTPIPGALVQNYFYNHYISYIRSNITAKLQEAYKLYPDYQYVFTGHSLGAAFATLTAFDMITQNIVPREQSIMYNFGSPRVGNYILAQAIEETIPELYRVTHWRDLVPHVPPCTKNKSDICLTTSLSDNLPISWPAYHLSPEIFFNDENTDYMNCVGGEDPMCSNQFNLAQTSMVYHYVYFNITMECVAAKTNVDNRSVFLGREVNSLIL